MNRAEITAVLATLSEVYPNRVGSGDIPKTVAVWAVILGDADAKQVLAATIAWVRSRKPHPPTPGELLDVMVSETTITPEEAWGLVRSEVQRAGYTHEPNLPELAMRAIKAVGGEWSAMCKGLMSRDVPSLRARFLDAYRGMESRGGKREAMAHADRLLSAPDALIALAGPLASRYAIASEESSESR